MIERVTPTAECATHVFLRRFEAPIRSQRSLDIAFWRQNGDHSCVPAWWPLYLDSIRNATSNKSSQEREWLMKSRTTVPTKLHNNRSSVYFPCRKLTYSSSSNELVSTAAQPEFDDIEQPSEKSWDATPQDHDNAPLEGQPAEESTNSSRFSRKPLSETGREQEAYSKAWSSFTRRGWKQDDAPVVLQLLSTSEKAVDLSRALKAFDIIPRSQRLVQDYRIAVDITTRLIRHSMAIRIIKEAISRSIGQDIYFKFLAYCVTNALWNTAADLWNKVGQPWSRILRLAAHEKTLRSPNSAGRFTPYFEAMDDLPLRVVVLSERLCNSDPFLVSRRGDLKELCKNLCITVVESQKFMSTITGTGLLSVLSIQNQLRFDCRLHFAALGTINRMSDKGSKSQLAILIYRNFRFLYPDAAIPKWVFGAMIGICSAGNHASQTYLALLEDYKSVHGIPDDLTYSQLMRACAEQGASTDLQFIFDEFCKYSRPRSVSDINPLIRVHAVIGQNKEAQSQFDSLPSQFGFSPDVKTWNALLLAYARSDESDRTYDVFGKMIHSEVQPDQYCWTILVSVATKKGDTDRARNILWQAEQAGISPPTAMLGALVDSCLLNDQIEEAEKIVIRATMMTGDDSPTRLWNSLFRYHAFKANFESILHTQKRMKEFNVRPDGMTYAALMTALVVQGRTREAAKILRTLHFSQSLNATPFHYSIIIHGFAMENNHEMALLVCQELENQFPRLTLSARLTKYRLMATHIRNSNEELHPKIELQELLKAMQNIFEDIQPSDLASAMPNPGFGRKAARNDLEALFLRSLVAFIERRGAGDAARDVLALMTNSDGTLLSNVPRMNVSWSSSLDSISLELDLAIKREAWSDVDKFWDQILDLVLQNCCPSGGTGIPNSATLSTTTNQTNTTRHDAATQFRDMIPQQSLFNKLHGTTTRVLPAHRFVLSRQITRYMLALDKQNSHQKLIDWVPLLQKSGLELSSRNWNVLLQALCRSTNLKHRLMAFELFEKHMLPNTPSWLVIRQGKWVKPSEEAPSIKGSLQKDNRQSRKLLEKAKPDLLMPSYLTMIHLAMAMMKSSRVKSADNATFIEKLRKDAPRTLRVVQNTPYLRDRLQGVLLRGRQVIGDLIKRPRQSRASETFAGIKNSQMAIDKLPPEVREIVEKLPAPRDDIRRLLKGLPSRRDRLLSKDTIEEVKNYLEDTVTTPVFLDKRNRFETQEEVDKRVFRENRTKLRMLENIVKDAQTRRPLVGTASYGDPQSRAMTLVPRFESLSSSTHDSDEHRLATFKQLSRIIDGICGGKISDLGVKFARVAPTGSPSSRLIEPRRSRIQLESLIAQKPLRLTRASSRSFSKNKAYRAIRATKRARKTRVRVKRLFLRSPKPLEIFA